MDFLIPHEVGPNFGPNSCANKRDATIASQVDQTSERHAFW